LAKCCRFLLRRCNSISTTFEFRHGIVKRKLQNVGVDAIGREFPRFGRVVSPCDYGIDAVQSTEKYILKFCKCGSWLWIELPGTHPLVLASVADIVRAASPNCHAALVRLLIVNHVNASFLLCLLSLRLVLNFNFARRVGLSMAVWKSRSARCCIS